MRYKTRTGLFLFAILLTSIVAFAQVKSNQSIDKLKTEKMKEYILLIRLPLSYGAEQASAVRAQWAALTDQWKADGIFVTSFVFPSESYVVSANDKVVNEEVISNDLKVISSLVIRASSFEEALQLAKKCPILEQGVDSCPCWPTIPVYVDPSFLHVDPPHLDGWSMSYKVRFLHVDPPVEGLFLHVDPPVYLPRGLTFLHVDPPRIAIE